jgi:hypothetical protein
MHGSRATDVEKVALRRIIETFGIHVYKQDRLRFKAFESSHGVPRNAAWCVLLSNRPAPHLGQPDERAARG